MRVDPTSAARRATGAASRSRGLKALARAGFVVSGVVHLLLAWIALRLAWSGTQENADTSGAFGTLAQHPLGLALLWVGAAGFVALAIWQLAEAVTGSDTGDRVKAVGKAVVHLALAWSAAQFAIGSGSDSAQQSQSATATLLAQPAGVVLVVVLGLGVVAVGVHHVVKGVRKTFLEDLRSHPGRAAEIAGRVGYVSKGVALAVVGGLFVAAALGNDPEEATGIDGALRTLLALPFGQVLATVVALGLAAYGVYSCFRARYADL